MKISRFLTYHLCIMAELVVLPVIAVAYLSHGVAYAIQRGSVVMLIILTAELFMAAVLRLSGWFTRWWGVFWAGGAVVAGVLAIAELYVWVRLGVELNGELVAYGWQLLPALGQLLTWPVMLVLVVTSILLVIAARAGWALEVFNSHDRDALSGVGRGALGLAVLVWILVGYQEIPLWGAATASSGDEEYALEAPRISFPDRLVASGDAFPNVVMILLETTKASATTPYAPLLDTTPFLQTLAEEGVVGERAYVPMPHSYKSLVSVFCGIPPHPSIVEKIETEPGGIPAPCLPKLLEEHGYRTGYFQTTSERHDNRRQQMENMGFGTIVASEHLNKEEWEKISVGYEDKILVEPMMQWVDEQDGPFLLTAITMASHFPYKTPEGFLTKEYSEEANLNKYLNTLRYTDSFLEEVYRGLEKRGLLDNTIFVVVGDHGEDFGNHIPEGHHQNVYNDSIQVPLVVWGGADVGIEATRISDPVSHLDIAPTVVDALGMVPWPRPFYGKSLFEDIGPREIYSLCTFKDCGSVIRDTHKYIVTQRGKSEYYDVVADPEEHHDLVETLPEEKRQLLGQRIKAWKVALERLYERR